MTEPARPRTPRTPAARTPPARTPPAATSPAAPSPAAPSPAATSPAAPAERVRSGSGGHWPMADRSIVPSVLGVPPLIAVGIAAALTAIGVLVDLTRAGTLGAVFTVCFVVGCVLAVAWVRRSGLFGPMVAPPLLLAVAVPVVVLLAGTPKPGAGIAERLLVIGAPLVNSFPTMAWVTGIVVALGVFRLVVQRQPPERRPSGREAVSARPGSERGAARGEARKSGSPRRS